MDFHEVNVATIQKTIFVLDLHTFDLTLVSYAKILITYAYRNLSFVLNFFIQLCPVKKFTTKHTLF